MSSIGPESIEVLRRGLSETRADTLAWLDTVIWHLVEHELHHKGQLALYLHLCGIEAPFFAFALPPGVRPGKRPFATPSPTAEAS